jgi:hypothetical protein
MMIIILERSQKVHYIALNGRMTHEWEASDHSVSEVLSRHLPGGTEKTTKNLSQDSWWVKSFTAISVDSVEG